MPFDYPQIEDPPPYGYRVPIQDEPAGPMWTPPEVWAGSPSPVIDQANASAPLNRVYADSQNNAYTAELQRDAMQDPRYALAVQAARIKAQEDAMRFAGQQEFQQLVAGGATPEEAMRRTAGKLFFNHPDKMATALSRIPAAGVVPNQLNAIPIMSSGQPIGNAVYDPHGRLHATQFTPKEPTPPDVKANQKVIEAQMQDARRELAGLNKVIALDPKDAASIKRRDELAAKVGALEQQFVEGSTNWMQAPPARVQAAAPAPAKSEIPFKEGQTIRNKNTGKLYIVRNGEPVPL